MTSNELAECFESARPELTDYLRRLVLRPAVAEELVQETALRALRSHEQAPDRTPTAAEIRPWLFRIASRLGLDERRRRLPLPESVMLDARRAAQNNEGFLAAAAAARGSVEMTAVAREHLTVCFSCTLGRLREEWAAALLLREVFGFGNDATAEILEARPAQVKNWLQAARAEMDAHYGATCALINKQGVCYQCVELDRFHGANRGDPLAGTPGTIDDRVRIVREFVGRPPSRWTQMLSDLLAEIV